MNVTLDHVTLRTRDLTATREFLIDLLDLTEGFRPDFGFPGHQPDANDQPIVHLLPDVGINRASRAAEAIDHVGFRAADTAKPCQRLIERDLAQTEQTISALNEHRLFPQTPTGIVIELVARHAPRPNASIAESLDHY